MHRFPQNYTDSAHATSHIKTSIYNLKYDLIMLTSFLISDNKVEGGLTV